MPTHIKRFLLKNPSVCRNKEKTRLFIIALISTGISHLRKHFIVDKREKIGFHMSDNNNGSGEDPSECFANFSLNVWACVVRTTEPDQRCQKQ